MHDGLNFNIYLFIYLQDAKTADILHENRSELNQLNRTVENLQDQIKKLKATSNTDVVRLNRQQEEILKMKSKEQEDKKEVNVRT